VTVLPIAYEPFADPDDFIREVTDRIWVEREIGYIRQNYEPDSIVHGSLGTSTGREEVVEGTLMRLAEFPNRVGQAEDVIWEARGDDAFLSSHLVLGTDLINLEFRQRNIANCLYRRGRMVEEWVVRDSLAIARSLGIDPDEWARRTAFRGYAGSMLEPAPTDVLAAGVSGARPDDRRPEARTVLEFIDTVWNRRDMKQVESFCLRDLVLDTVDDRTVTRPEGYRRAMLRFLRSFPGGHFDVIDVATNEAVRYGGTRVAVTWRFTGQYNGFPTYGALTGRPVDVLGVSQFTLHQGRIVREVKLWDDVAVRAQIAATRGDEPFTGANIY
jgi:steroid delta-isomerase-like uncharacterized protein